MTDLSGGEEGGAEPVEPLDEPVIEDLVARYRREMARYDLAANEVATRLRRELRAEARLRHVISFRAKHPEDLREKLRRKSGKAGYAADALKRNLNDVVTDLAGCRVIVYAPEDEQRVVELIDRAFSFPDRSDARPEPLRRPTGYRATHRLVLAAASDDDVLIHGAICEIQVTTVAAHLFNELDHDIQYKHHGEEPTADDKDTLERIRRLAEVADEQVSHLVEARKRAKRAQELISDAETLRFWLEHHAGRPLAGDFYRLHRMLEGTVSQLTQAAILAFGDPNTVMARGADEARKLGIAEVDDVIHFALGLDALRDEFIRMVASWKGPRTPIRRAIERAAGAAGEQGVDDRRERTHNGGERT